MKQIENISRIEQLEHLGSHLVNDEPVLIHGSIGHAALMANFLPSEDKFWGEERDIDLLAPGTDKAGLEFSLSEAGFGTPNPLDAGLCGLLITEGANRYAQKDGVVVQLRDASVFDEIRAYEIPGTNGIKIQSFNPMGMKAVNTLEPQYLRLSHFWSDQKLKLWFERNEIELPKGLKTSIDEFHQAYKAAYPYGAVLHQLAEVYATVIPEGIRRQFRSYTHHFMLRHAGRKTPFAEFGQRELT